ncbi:MAG: response regulator transcription factor [Bacteroidales bacterium]|nr:response regulator transcription factor [Bacteroidales bacterium]
MIKVVLADDHTLFRDGIKSLLAGSANIQVVGTFENGTDLIANIPQTDPDLVLTDISMPGLSGIETTKILMEKYPQLKIIILSMHLNDDFVCNSVRAGAKGYLPKDIRKDELLKAIEAVYQGDTYFTKEVNEVLMQSLLNRNQEDLESEKLKALTKREIEIITLVGEGLINKEIANRLSISVRTVDAHKSNIMHKLELKSNVEIVKFAIKHQLITI